MLRAPVANLSSSSGSQTFDPGHSSGRMLGWKNRLNLRHVRSAALTLHTFVAKVDYWWIVLWQGQILHHCGLGGFLDNRMMLSPHSL